MMSWQRTYWFRDPLTIQLHVNRDNVGLGEATINNTVNFEK